VSKKNFKAITSKKTFSKKCQKVFKATSAQNKIQNDKNKKKHFQRGKQQKFFKATGAKNNFHRNNSKKSFSKRQEQKIIFAAISAKKQFSKRKAPKNIFKATTTQETFSKRQTHQIHFKAKSAKKNLQREENRRFSCTLDVQKSSPCLEPAKLLTNRFERLARRAQGNPEPEKAPTRVPKGLQKASQRHPKSIFPRVPARR